jgi:hypothetical protein
MSPCLRPRELFGSYSTSESGAPVRNLATAGCRSNREREQRPMWCPAEAGLSVQVGKGQARVVSVRFLIPVAVPGETPGEQNHARSPHRIYDHPCLGPFFMWSICLLIAVLLATAGKSPFWVLLGVPALPWMTIYGASIASGLPRVDVEQTVRLDRILIEVGGTDAFTVTAQYPTDSPVLLLRRERPRIYAAAGFVRDADAATLRGAAALQHAALTDPSTAKRLQFVNVCRVILMVGLALAAGAVAPAGKQIIAAIATVGVSQWIPGVILSARSSLKRTAADYRESDRTAARLAGDPRAVADALINMAAWRSQRRASRSPILRAAQRAITPILPCWHEAARASALLSG